MMRFTFQRGEHVHGPATGDWPLRDEELDEFETKANPKKRGETRIVRKLRAALEEQERK